MKKEILFVCAVLFFLNGPGQVIHGLPSLGINSSGAYNLLYADALSFAINPASLGTVKQFYCGSLIENKWMLEGLNEYTIAASFPFGAGGAGMLIHQSGDEAFHETGFKLAYGKNLGKPDIGIVFDYLRDRVAGYGSAQFISLGIALRYRVTEKFTGGWELGLPVFANAGKTSPEKAPQYFCMGFGYAPEDNLILSLRIEKPLGQPADISGWLEYRYEDHFIFSAGIRSMTGSFFLSSGWKKNRLTIQVSGIYEPLLGISPGLLLLWESTKKAK